MKKLNEITVFYAVVMSFDKVFPQNFNYSIQGAFRTLSEIYDRTSFWGKKLLLHKK